MTLATAWHELVREWAPLFGEGLRVLTYPGVSQRQVGDWWRDGADWCVQLDQHHYACVDASGLVADAKIRNVFRYSLCQTQVTNLSWQQKAREYAEQVMRHSNGEVRKLAGGGELDIAQRLLPGHFIWVGFTDGDLASHDRKQAVEEVVAAYAQDTFVAWLTGQNRTDFALLYLSSTEGEDTATSPREWMQELLRVLEMDAYTSASAAIGDAVLSSHHAWNGIETAWFTWCQRSVIHKPPTVLVWGERPWTQLLAALPANVTSMFCQLVERHSPVHDVSLTPELQEALFGIISANLNVSEASRLLYLHRNTLNHRIEKIKQQTGYDVRNFEDALTLWVYLSLTKQSSAAITI